VNTKRDMANSINFLSPLLCFHDGQCPPYMVLTGGHRGFQGSTIVIFEPSWRA
jgi:hypothetical protein